MSHDHCHRLRIVHHDRCCFPSLMVLSTVRAAGTYPRIFIGAMINVTSTLLPFSHFSINFFSYPILRIVPRRRIDVSWSMSACIVAPETLSSFRACDPDGYCHAHDAPRGYGCVVRFASKGISRWLIYFRRSLFRLSPTIYHCFVNFLLSVCRQNSSSCCPCSTRTWVTKRRSCSQAGDQRCLKGDPRDP